MSASTQQASTGSQPAVNLQYEGNTRDERQVERMFRQIADQSRDIGEVRGYDVTTSVTNTSNVRDRDGRRERTVRLIVDYTFTAPAGE